VTYIKAPRRNSPPGLFGRVGLNRNLGWRERPRKRRELLGGFLGPWQVIRGKNRTFKINMLGRRCTRVLDQQIAKKRRRNLMAHVQRIVPCLWFDKDAEEAANFYVSLFENSRIVRTTRYGKAGHGVHGKPEGSVLTVVFSLAGQEFTALNGGPAFKFDEAISLQVFCETQEEVDFYWSRLTASGGEEGPCGWLKDKYGLSWQITPTILAEMLNDPDPVKTDNVMNALLQMRKLDIATLKRAYAGE
jgi:predicted 3-demethylubiquinone-9 3-methyltransferase (glyoxalase superfamily)